MSLYTEATEITGPLQHGSKVTYRGVFSHRDRIILACLIGVCLLTNLSVIVWLLWPEHLSLTSSIYGAVGIIALALMVSVQLLQALQGLTLALFAANAKDPIPLQPLKAHRVASSPRSAPARSRSKW